MKNFIHMFTSILNTKEKTEKIEYNNRKKDIILLLGSICSDVLAVVRQGRKAENLVRS
jgi:hypothetical protein